MQIEKMMAFVDGDASLFAEMVQLYFAHVPGLLDDVRQAITSGDCEDLARTAHSLKGSLGHFGAPEAYDAAWALENMGMQQNLQRVHEVFKTLESQMASLTTVLQGMRKGS